MSAIAITGLGAVSSVGRGVQSLRDALFAGRDGIAPTDRMDVTPFAPVHLFGCVADDAPERGALGGGGGEGSLQRRGLSRRGRS